MRKDLFKKTCCIILLTFVVIFISSCTPASIISGTYSGFSEEMKIPMSMSFYSNGQVETNLLGFPLTGTYEVSGKTLKVTLISFGMAQTFNGLYEDGKVIFADILLEKQ